MSKKHYKKINFVADASPAVDSKKLELQKEKPKMETAKDKRMPFGVTVGIAIVVTLVVIAVGFYYLVQRNSDVLFLAQERSFFTTNFVFLTECMRLPGGFISWSASFLTQFFYQPELGATIMIGIWVLSLWMSKLAFKVSAVWMAVLAVPVLALLVSMIDTGYWIYYIKQTGYWFYGTVGYFLAMLLMLFYRMMNTKRAFRITVTVLIALTYPFMGWYTLLALVYIAVIALTQCRHESSWVYRIGRPVLPLVLALVVPMLCYRLYADVNPEELWMVGFPIFIYDIIVSDVPSIPFIVLSAVPVLFPLLPSTEQLRKWGGAWIACVATLVVLAAGIWWVEKRDFKDYNYHADMRIYRAADEADWETLLDEMGNLPGDASRQMVLLKNVALINTGEMGTKMFKYNNMSEQPTNHFDTLRVHLMQTAAPLIYFYHGKTNFASRWCIENSVEYGISFDNLKLLARCALVSGESDLARKYLSILQTSLYHKEWADRLMPITNNPKLIAKYHEFDVPCELYNHMGSVLDSDQGFVELYLLNYFSNTMNKDSKLMQEVTLNYALVQKDIQLFWPRFFLYATLHQNEPMPVHYQEAAILYGNLEKNEVDISGMPFDQDVRDRFVNFQQTSISLVNNHLSTKEVGEAMKSMYGGTFWWFYFFSNDLLTY